MKFRKKPVVIEAVQFTRRFDWPEWFHDAVSRNDVITHGTGKFADPKDECFCDIKTLEGVMRANEGDWIIRGIKGEIYPCKPDIFAATYEAADSAQPVSVQAEPVAWRLMPANAVFSNKDEAYSLLAAAEHQTHVEPLFAAPPVADSQDAARYRFIKDLTPSGLLLWCNHGCQDSDIDTAMRDYQRVQEGSKA